MKKKARAVLCAAVFIVLCACAAGSESPYPEVGMRLMAQKAETADHILLVWTVENRSEQTIHIDRNQAMIIQWQRREYAAASEALQLKPGESFTMEYSLPILAGKAGDSVSVTAKTREGTVSTFSMSVSEEFLE